MTDLPDLQQRFNLLLVSTKLANESIGRRSPGEVTYEESEQADARRRLLHIEKLTAAQKASQEKATAEKIKQVSDALHTKVIEELHPKFTNSTYVAVSILGLSEDIAELLDLLSTKACSVPRLEPLVYRVPWLHEAILREINLPQNRRIDAKGRPIKIESIRTALSSLGVDNLKALLPCLIFKFATPPVTDPYPEIKNKLFEYSVGVANTMARLSKLLDLRHFDAYLLGMFSQFGLCASARLYFREFDGVLNKFTNEAMSKKDQTTYNTLKILQPLPENLTQLYSTYERELTIRSLEFLAFKRVSLLPAFLEPNDPYHEALSLAQCFAQLKMLIAYRLVTKEEAKRQLSTLKIAKAWLEPLNASGLFKMDVDMS
jgi:hypothetical protein